MELPIDKDLPHIKAGKIRKMTSAARQLHYRSPMTLAAISLLLTVHRVSSMPAACDRWDGVMPPVSGNSKWIVHRADTVYGLGDYLAGVFSAFILAASTGRRFYVDHPFGDLVSFAPYDIPPSENDWKHRRRFLVGMNVCPGYDEVIGTDIDKNSRVTIYEGGDTLDDGTSLPANRACAWSWRENVTKVWKSLGGPDWRDGDYDAFFKQPHVVYGCVLSLFNPSDAVRAMIPTIPGVDKVIGVHVRSGDSSFDEDGSNCVNEYSWSQANEIMSVRDTIQDERVGYRIESDSACVREFLAHHVASQRPNDIVARAIAPPAHDILSSGLGPQLAAWFALSTASMFVVSPMYTPMSQDPQYDKYAHCPPRFFSILANSGLGFADHSLLRLSSWSVMAALKAGTYTVHVLCSKAPPPGWDTLKHDYPISVDKVPKYTCDTSIPSSLALANSPEKGAKPVNVHFIDPKHLNSTKDGSRQLIWGIGNFI